MEKCKNCLNCHFQTNGKCTVLKAPALRKGDNSSICSFYKTEQDYFLSRMRACDNLVKHTRTAGGKEVLRDILGKYPSVYEYMKEFGYQQVAQSCM